MSTSGTYIESINLRFVFDIQIYSTTFCIRMIWNGPLFPVRPTLVSSPTHSDWLDSGVIFYTHRLRRSLQRLQLSTGHYLGLISAGMSDKAAGEAGRRVTSLGPAATCIRIWLQPRTPSKGPSKVRGLEREPVDRGTRRTIASL